MAPRGKPLKPIRLNAVRHQDDGILITISSGRDKIGTVHIPPIGGVPLQVRAADLLMKRLATLNMYVQRAWDRAEAAKPTIEASCEDQETLGLDEEEGE